MSRAFELVGNVVNPGERVNGELGSVELADGTRIRVPVIIINGKAEGPVLTVSTGIHGTELTGIAALLEAIKEIDPSEMAGVLIGVPGANGGAVRNGVYKNPFDSCNDVGDYVFAEDLEDPTMSQRMSMFVGRALKVADYAIDMHANPLPSIPFALMHTAACPDKETASEAVKICEAFGITVINWTRAVRNIRDACSQRGIPAITPELAGNIYLLDDEAVEVGKTGILNVMKVIGMLEGEPIIDSKYKLEGDFVAVGRLVADRGGLLFVKQQPGTKVQKGGVVAEIVSRYGEVLQEVTMPHTGYCWSFTGGLNGSHAINEGDKIAYTFAERKDIE